ncbi:hypothetical protein SARC_09625 [Sphaeroforma arctica JP610]|uniref:Uncharacterized protein n=1 Tax=Sphaeroforma arctica JP610 TaxID=667725 RepID=A0A0L0FME6_9EUKA|nr:hypothetical protein SARC_09625 [Sphaeroforma arctica JP610]KNC77930.1 hypothetical protein SARC_09625 [Sphaeroforma arctica JP610]|eukprot:XP_014151832.1 hypothetical protein SARC_09625 [Sphaeroforma arctica JP610]
MSFEFATEVPRKFAALLNPDLYAHFIEDLNGCFQREVSYYKQIREQGRCCYLRSPALCQHCRTLQLAIEVSQIALNRFNETLLHQHGLHVALRREEITIADDYFGTTSGKRRSIPYTFTWLEFAQMGTGTMHIQRTPNDKEQDTPVPPTVDMRDRKPMLKRGEDDGFTKKMKEGGLQHTKQDGAKVMLNYNSLPPLGSVSALARTPLVSPNTKRKAGPEKRYGLPTTAKKIPPPVPPRKRGGASVNSQRSEDSATEGADDGKGFAEGMEGSVSGPNAEESGESPGSGSDKAAYDGDGHIQANLGVQMDEEVRGIAHGLSITATDRNDCTEGDPNTTRGVGKQSDIDDVSFALQQLALSLTPPPGALERTSGGMSAQEMNEEQPTSL